MRLKNSSSHAFRSLLYWASHSSCSFSTVIQLVFVLTVVEANFSCTEVCTVKSKCPGVLGNSITSIEVVSPGLLVSVQLIGTTSVVSLPPPGAVGSSMISVSVDSILPEAVTVTVLTLHVKIGKPKPVVDAVQVNVWGVLQTV